MVVLCLYAILRFRNSRWHNGVIGIVCMWVGWTSSEHFDLWVMFAKCLLSLWIIHRWMDDIMMDAWISRESIQRSNHRRRFQPKWKMMRKVLTSHANCLSIGSLVHLTGYGPYLMPRWRSVLAITEPFWISNSWGGSWIRAISESSCSVDRTCGVNEIHWDFPLGWMLSWPITLSLSMWFGEPNGNSGDCVMLLVLLSFGKSSSSPLLPARGKWSSSVSVGSCFFSNYGMIMSKEVQYPNWIDCSVLSSNNDRITKEH